MNEIESFLLGREEHKGFFMSLLIVSEVKGQFFDITLLAIQDGSAVVLDHNTFPIRSEISHFHIIELELEAIDLSLKLHHNLLSCNVWDLIIAENIARTFDVSVRVLLSEDSLTLFCRIFSLLLEVNELNLNLPEFAWQTCNVGRSTQF